MWDHHPSADELLSARLDAGWKPTPTSTVDGDQILGHAACVVTETTDAAAQNKTGFRS